MRCAAISHHFHWLLYEPKHCTTTHIHFIHLMHIIPVAWIAAPAPSSAHDTRSSSHPPFQHSYAARHAAVNTSTYTRAFAFGLQGPLFVRSSGPFAIFTTPVTMIRRHAMHLFRTALHHVFASVTTSYSHFALPCTITPPPLLYLASPAPH